MMKPVIYALLLVFCLQFNCKNNNQIDSVASSPVEGIWYYIENDSIYGEVIFTKSHLWTYDEGGGEIFVEYHFLKDSIEFNGITSKFSKVNKDEFVLARDQMSVHYYRLNADVDTAGLLRGDEHVFDEYIIKGLRERKYEWDQKRKQ